MKSCARAYSIANWKPSSHPLFINYPTIYLQLQITINFLSLRAVSENWLKQNGSLRGLDNLFAQYTRSQTERESNCEFMNGKIWRKIAVYDAPTGPRLNNSNLHLCYTKTFQRYVILHTWVRCWLMARERDYISGKQPVCCWSAQQSSSNLLFD